uniref:Ovule protein n=1 Tax=Mesocestoides corti TaxID=53468 RepID=A0A5K3G7N3_MESCO
MVQSLSTTALNHDSDGDVEDPNPTNIVNCEYAFFVCFYYPVQFRPVVVMLSTLRFTDQLSTKKHPEFVDFKI